jgi:glutamate/tyrosine decarboxylase-like PLP-dependent enzyme
LWIVNPVQTELENVVCDWIVDALDLPDKFYLKNLGGGAISTTVSDSVFLTVHTAKRRKLLEIGANERDPRVLKLVAYYSESAHSSTMKGCHLP